MIDAAPAASRNVASKREVESSGVAVEVEGIPHTPVETLLSSSVTAAFSAMAFPQAMFAPVSRDMLWSARILPMNSVYEPRVAELPTCQYTLSPEPGLITTTDAADEPVAVVKWVDGTVLDTIWRIDNSSSS